MEFSIIIPHFNIPQLLQRCLDSIPFREDLEVIIVDDHSSAEIVDFDRFPGLHRPDTTIVFSEEGGGGGAARNKGLERATGKWVIFADADDFFYETFGEALDDFKEANADMVFFNANSLVSNSLAPAKNRAKHLDQYIRQWGSAPSAAALRLRYWFGEPWGRMIKRSLLVEHAIRFDETRIHNDTTFSYLVGYYANVIAVDSRVLYCITVREGSVSKELSEERIMTRVEVFGKAFIFFKSKGLRVDLPILQRQLAQLLLKNRHLYRRACDILVNFGLSEGEIRRLLWRALPKEFVKFIFRK